MWWKSSTCAFVVQLVHFQSLIFIRSFIHSYCSFYASLHFSIIYLFVDLFDFIFISICIGVCYTSYPVYTNLFHICCRKKLHHSGGYLQYGGIGLAYVDKNATKGRGTEYMQHSQMSTLSPKAIWSVRSSCANLKQRILLCSILMSVCVKRGLHSLNSRSGRTQIVLSIFSLLAAVLAPPAFI